MEESIIMDTAINNFSIDACNATPDLPGIANSIPASNFNTFTFWNARSRKRDFLSTVFDLQRDSLWKKLKEFKSLSGDWDGYGADVISESCITNVKHFLENLPENIPSPSITPNSNGTITLDWEKRDLSLSIEVGETNYSTFYESTTGVKMDSGRLLPYTMPEVVATALEIMFPTGYNVPPSLQEFVYDVAVGY
jgi:hypothetical protein